MTVMRVGVILGGISSEREASLASGRQVCVHLDPQKYTVIPVFMDLEGRLWHIPQKLLIQNTTADIISRLEGEAERIPYENLCSLVDFAFIALHGKYGDDGCVQGVLELLGIPYTGSGVLASAVCMDKYMAHTVLKQAGVEVANELLVEDLDWEQDRDAVRREILETVGLPCVIKPDREGSSIGVTVVGRDSEIDAGLEEAFSWDNLALVEEYLSGLEFSCIVLGNEELQPLVPTETATKNEYLTYEDKYMPGQSQKITPARVSEELLAKIQHEVMKAYRALGMKNYGRIDGFLVDGDRVLITDPNSSSGMAPSSFLFHQAADIGLNPTMLFDRMIELALEAHAAKKGPL
ncbi:MAG: D-alanine--D-alanine ligase [Anaerolineae bacterium]|nr:D-alanine--D-alanine ligase [Anaerolineae bacterium]NIN99167.1 D-alanine--D-alanine ligase [Anaerolineae bacterium]NIQ82008.1 D-alanine--D-alanine ligase [Anaerolineae bacterium]